jgi:CheY-like chemotaxis protein
LLWLVAEDEADILNLIATMCQVWGHKTLTFESGGKVWNWLDEVEAGKHNGQMPDFVLMDIRMPGKKGNEVANRMRRIPAFAHLPIALMTAYQLSDDERAAIIQTDGVDKVISKPLPSFEELRVLLNTIITDKQANTNNRRSEKTR